VIHPGVHTELSFRLDVCSRATLCLLENWLVVCLTLLSLEPRNPFFMVQGLTLSEKAPPSALVFSVVLPSSVSYSSSLSRPLEVQCSSFTFPYMSAHYLPLSVTIILIGTHESVFNQLRGLRHTLGTYRYEA
jgi:hypothetical protein